MTITAPEINLGQWEERDLRDDVRRCMNALSMLARESPAYAGLVRHIGSAVHELRQRLPADPGETSSAVCRCGEVFLTPDDATAHFVKVFVPAGNIGSDGRIHEEICLATGTSAGWECQVPAVRHGAAPCEDGCREPQP